MLVSLQVFASNGHLDMYTAPQNNEVQFEFTINVINEWVFSQSAFILIQKTLVKLLSNTSQVTMLSSETI